MAVSVVMAVAASSVLASPSPLEEEPLELEPLELEPLELELELLSPPHPPDVQLAWFV